jgi:hypothetical protein
MASRDSTRESAISLLQISFSDILCSKLSDGIVGHYNHKVARSVTGNICCHIFVITNNNIGNVRIKVILRRVCVTIVAVEKQ